MKGTLSQRLRTRDGRPRRWRAAVLLLALLPLAAGCFGEFPATRAVYKLNRQTSDDQATRSAFMWPLIPLYGLGAIGDMILLNPFEYWTGAPIGGREKAERDGVSVALAPTTGSREAARTPSLDGKLLGPAPLARTPDERPGRTDR